jgi:TPR repeat protein
MKRIVFFITLMMLFSFTASPQKYVKKWEKQAKAGDQVAQYKLGEWYKGEKNDKKSLKWYRKAADQGNADACYEMAQLCIKGLSKDDPSMWLLKAAENGNNDIKMKVVDKLLSINQEDKAYDLLMSMVEKGDNDIKMQVADKLLSFNQKDKVYEAYELLMSIVEKGDNSTKMQVADYLLSIGENSKAIILLKSWAEQSESFDWTKSIVDKLISLGDIEIIHLPKIQEKYCIYAEAQFYLNKYEVAYNTLTQVIDQSDSPAKKLLSELKAREQAMKAHEQAMKAREQARKDSLDRHFSHGAWYDGPISNGVPSGSGVLRIPYQGQEIRAEIRIFSNGAPLNGWIYAFGNEFTLTSDRNYSIIEYHDPSHFYTLTDLITKYTHYSMNTLIEEIIKNVDKLKNAKRNLAKQKANREKRQREEEKRKKNQYHSTPKEVMCFYCTGKGYIEARDFDGSLQKRWRCTNCYGRGYTLEHYY